MKQKDPSSQFPTNISEYLNAIESEADFNDVLQLSRSLSFAGRLKDAELCNNWLLERRPMFTPAIISMCSNYLKLGDFEGIKKLLNSKQDGLITNDDQLELLKYILAKANYETKDYLNAEKIIINDLSEREGKPLWYNLLEIDLLNKLGKTEELLKLLDEKIEFYPDNRVLINKKFEILNKAGEFQNAYHHIIVSLAKDPNNADLLFHKAVIHFNNQELLESKLSFAKIIELTKEYRAHLWMGRILTIEDDLELASSHFKTATQSVVSNDDKFYCLNILTEINHDALIDELIGEWFDFDLIQSDVLHQIAQIRIKQMKYDEARYLLEQAIVQKEDVRYYFELSKVASFNKEYDKAESILILNNLLSNSSLAYFARNEYCLIARRRGRFTEALQRFKDFSYMYPDDFRLKSEIVNLLLKLSLYKEATDYLLGEIDLNPSNMQAWLALIDCYFQNQNYFSSLSKIDNYIQKFGKDEKVLKLKSASLREVGRYEECESVIQNALELYPDSFDLKISQAHLYRRLSSEYFFEKEKYNLKALSIHQSTKAAHAYQKRVLNIEVINDLIHLNRFSEALEKIDVFLEERAGHTEMYYHKVRVLSKMGSHQKAYNYIQDLPESFREDANLLVLEANELLSLDRWEDCIKVLEKIDKIGNYPEAFIINIKLHLRKGEFVLAKSFFFQLIDLSPHHAFIHNEIMDFGLTFPETYQSLADKLGIEYKVGEDSMIELKPKETKYENDKLILDYGEAAVISHILINQRNVAVDDILVSGDNDSITMLSNYKLKVKFDGENTLIRGAFNFRCISIPDSLKAEVKVFTVFPFSSNGNFSNSYNPPKKDFLFSTNIVETGLGDQLHYIRTSGLIGESLGMKFAGFLKSELEIIRDRVTEDPRLYSDLGFTELILEDKKYFKINVSLKLTTRFVPAFYQWHSFTLFLKYINGLIDEAIQKSNIPEGATPLIFLSVDDHNFTRLFARLFYPFSEPKSDLIHRLKNSFIKKRKERTQLSSSDKLTVLLQCRLGDVANIPIRFEGEDVWVIPFSGEVMKQSQSSKYHMRYSNLEKILEIGNELKNKFGSRVNLKLITDGYDYGIDYLKTYKVQLMEEMNMNSSDLDKLKIKLAADFKEKFSFVDEIVYGEDYDKLIRSIDLVTGSKIIISTNGQFTSEIKMSFSGDDEKYLIVKKLYSNLRVSRSSNTKELFWEIDGVDQSEMTGTIVESIQNFIAVN